MLLSTEVLTRAVFAILARVVVDANHPAGSLDVAGSWFNPFALHSWSSPIDGVRLGLFSYGVGTAESQ